MSRCAIRARRRVMGTRCSARAPAGAAGRGAGARAAGAGVAAAAGAAVPAVAGGASTGRLPRNPTTSDLVSLPSRPEAGIAAGSRWFSSSSRRTEGLNLPASLPPSLSASGGVLAAAAAAPAGFGAAAAAAPSSMSARTCPLFTTAPLCTRISRTTPLAGAGTSSTTLSVSRSARFSSRAMASPGCLCHVTSVASAMDSGSCGTRISVVMNAFSWGRRHGRGRRRRRRGRRWRRGSGRQTRGLTRGFLGGGRMQLGGHEGLLLDFVDLGDTRRRRRGRPAAGVQHRAASRHQFLQTMTDLVPGALILRFLLAPHDLARVGVAVEHRLVLIAREGIELLDAHQRHVAQRLLAALLQQIEIHLAAAEHDPLHLLRGHIVDLADHAREAATAEILEG